MASFVVNLRLLDIVQLTNYLLFLCKFSIFHVFLSCYKCFTDEQALLDHIPKHKESKHLKIHICGFCGKSYTQATYLAKHMTKHADRKPIKASVNDDHMWSRDGSICTVHGITDSCGDMSPPSALSFSKIYNKFLVCFW